MERYIQNKERETIFSLFIYIFTVPFLFWVSVLNDILFNPAVQKRLENVSREYTGEEHNNVDYLMHLEC